jgi:hypothetical protein
MNKIYVGIDPGKDGYICIDYNEQFEFWAIPKIGKEFNILELSAIIRRISHLGKVHCVLEDVHAIYGSAAGSTFTFGFGCGLIEGMLAMVGIPYTKIQPKKWQKQMFEGVAIQMKKSTTGKTMIVDNKSMAEIAAKRLFPTVDLRDTPRCRTSHDGKVDALLLCEYAKRNFK